MALCEDCYEGECDHGSHPAVCACKNPDDGFTVMNPSSIGNPDETPQVFVGADIEAVLKPCAADAPSRGGYCGGVNGFHADDCPAVSS